MQNGGGPGDKAIRGRHLLFSIQTYTWNYTGFQTYGTPARCGKKTNKQKIAFEPGFFNVGVKRLHRTHSRRPTQVQSTTTFEFGRWNTIEVHRASHQTSWKTPIRKTHRGMTLERNHSKHKIPPFHVFTSPTSTDRYLLCPLQEEVS